MDERVVLYVAVYGDFEKGDIRVKLFQPFGGTSIYYFQNTLMSAGYDCNIYVFNNTDLPWLVGDE